MIKFSVEDKRLLLPLPYDTHPFRLMLPRRTLGSSLTSTARGSLAQCRKSVCSTSLPPHFLSNRAASRNPERVQSRRLISTTAATRPHCDTPFSPRRSHQRRFASSSAPDVPLEAIRNISAWGHIDAGKTTLTERLLYHTGGLLSSPDQAQASGSAALPGDVDSGSTVTDFLEQERERGITIQSAAVGPLWWTSSTASSDKPAKSTAAAITLIDTPGHIDFTVEVERALRVADGCIIILDSVAGVEAQTMANWKIGQRYGVKSNLLFLNKLDRVGASVGKCLRAFKERIGEKPALVQLPIWASEEDGGVAGVVDLLTLEENRFIGRAGEEISKGPIQDATLLTEARKARHALVETLASLDETLMEELFSIDAPAGEEPHQHISASSIRASLRSLTIAGKIIPTFVGSAAKNIGVQPLLDGVVDYLPSPDEAGDVRDERGMGLGTVQGTSEKRPDSKGGHKGKKRDAKARAVLAPSPSGSAASQKGTAAAASDPPLPSEQPTAAEAVSVNVKGSQLAALAFKVVWDKRRGPMTFVRVYSGALTKTTTLFNTATGTRERLNRLLLPFGSTYTEVDKLIGGQVGVLLGLRDTRTGDTLVDARDKSVDSTLRLRRVDVPPPVFSVSVEPHSKADEDAVNEALSMLVRTDPSLRLDAPGDDGAAGTSAFGAAGTNQTILSGMGELHLEIAKDRLQNEFGVKARIGSVRVSFRETIQEQQDAGDGAGGWSVVDEVIDKDMGGKRVKVGAKIAVRRLPEGTSGDESLGGNLVDIRLGSEGDEADQGNFESRADAKRSARQQATVQGAHPSNRSGAAEDGESNKSNASTSSIAEDGLDPEALKRQVLAGITAALSRGPLSSHPLSQLEVRVSNVQTFSPEVSPPKAISSILNSLVRKAVNQAGGQMMEPVMRVRIEMEEAFLGRVVGDVTAEQSGEIVDVEHEQAAAEGGVSADGADNDGLYIPDDMGGGAGPEGSTSSSQPGPGPMQKTTVVALVPLTKLVSYSSRLRALTAGGGTYTMRLEGFRTVGEDRKKQILEELGRL